MAKNHRRDSDRDRYSHRSSVKQNQCYEQEHYEKPWKSSSSSKREEKERSRRNYEEKKHRYSRKQDEEDVDYYRRHSHKRRKKTRSHSPDEKKKRKHFQNTKHQENLVTRAQKVFNGLYEPNCQNYKKTELPKEEEKITVFTMKCNFGPSKPYVVQLENSEMSTEKHDVATFTMECDVGPSRPPTQQPSHCKQREEVSGTSSAKNASPSLEEQLRQQELIGRLPVYYPGLMGCRDIGEFRILSTIAEGGYGEVFKAQNTRTDEIVALKKFKFDKETEGFPITALREINMLQSAGHHENIINIQEILVSESNTDIYMVMEYAEWDVRDLMDDMIRNEQFFDFHSAKLLLSQLLSGVEYLHNIHILHRDLKTTNLLIAENGRLKIADFGMAREIAARNLTPVVVTIWYRPPELLLNAKEYSTEIDMWSIGCIMAEFLTMKPLFRGSTVAEILHKIFTMMGTPSVEMWPDVVNLEAWQFIEFEPFPPGELRKQFVDNYELSELGFDLLNRLLSMNPKERICAQDALQHPWFRESPNIFE